MQRLYWRVVAYHKSRALTLRSTSLGREVSDIMRQVRAEPDSFTGIFLHTQILLMSAVLDEMIKEERRSARRVGDT